MKSVLPLLSSQSVQPQKAAVVLCISVLTENLPLLLSQIFTLSFLDQPEQGISSFSRLRTKISLKTTSTLSFHFISMLWMNTSGLELRKPWSDSIIVTSSVLDFPKSHSPVDLVQINQSVVKMTQPASLFTMRSLPLATPLSTASLYPQGLLSRRHNLLLSLCAPPSPAKVTHRLNLPSLSIQVMVTQNTPLHFSVLLAPQLTPFYLCTPSPSASSHPDHSPFPCS